MRPDKKIDYVELPARDLEKAKAFFSSLLGWTFTDYGPEYVAFNDGRMDGGFRKADAASSTDNGAALIVMYALDLEAIVDDVKALGGKILQPIFAFPGGRRFHFADPNGNEFAVWSDLEA